MCLQSECELYPNNHVKVPYIRGDNGIIFYGEYPGFEEERQRLPFVGESGQMAAACFHEAGLDWNRTAKMNALRCRIDKGKFSDGRLTKMIKCCRANTTEAIAALAPRIIIMAGNLALKQLTGRSGITANKGKWFRSKDIDNCWLFPVNNPAYICRNPHLKPAYITALNVVRAAVENNFQPVTEITGASYQEIQSLKSETTIFTDTNVLIGLDTETQGINWNDPNFVPISFSVSPVTGVGYDIVLFEENEQRNTHQILESLRGKVNRADYLWRTIRWMRNGEPTDVHVRPASGFMRKVTELWELVESDRIKKVLMNANYDYHVFDTLFMGVFGKIPRYRGFVADVQANANLIDENQFVKPNLVSLQLSFTDITSAYDHAFSQDYDKADMLAVPRKPRAYYAAADSDTTRRVFLSQWNVLNRYPKLKNYALKFTVPTLNSLRVMERNGAQVDTDRLPRMTDRMISTMEAYASDMLKLVPKKIRKRHENQEKFTRKKFLLDIMLNGFGIKWKKKSQKTGEPAFDKEVRKLLLDRATGDCLEFLNLYGQWQETHTFVTRYLNGFKKAIHVDNRIHTKFSLATTVTGRVASSDPNMQNIPKRSKLAKEIRSLIIPRPGYVLMAADESQSELRWITFLSGDPEMHRVYRDGGDIHLETAMSMARQMEKEWSSLSEDEKKDIRTKAKPVNFGVVYLISPEGLKTDAKTSYGADISLEDAESYIRAFFNKYRNIPLYHQNMIAFAQKYGYVESVLGRRRRLPDIRSDNIRFRSDAERRAVNFPIQGPSSDTVLIALNMIEDTGYDPDEFRPVLFIHDELVAEVREDKIDHYAHLMKWALTNPNIVFKRDFGFEMPVKLESDVKIGYNLSEMADL